MGGASRRVGRGGRPAGRSGVGRSRGSFGFDAAALREAGVNVVIVDDTAEHARTRKQFDRHIGFFQAVKHPLVEFMVAIDLARSHLYNAACAIDHEPVNAEQYARMAKASASDAAAFGSKKSIQLHGGIGFTWECFVHLYVKRQLHSQTVLGDATHQRTKLAELVL